MAADVPEEEDEPLSASSVTQRTVVVSAASRRLFPSCAAAPASVRGRGGPVMNSLIRAVPQLCEADTMPLAV